MKSDKYLIRQFKKGKAEAFSQIYQHYVERIYRFVFLKTLSKEESEDITSQVFCRLLEYLVSSSKKIRSLQAFLYQVARNLVNDFYRKQGKWGKELALEEEKEVVDDNLKIEEKIDQKLTLEGIKSALENLNDNYKDIIILYYLEELSVKEIAEIMEKSEGAVRVLIHRALKELRRELNQ